MSAEVAAFQAMLLEVLAAAPDGEAALAEIRRRPEAAPFREAVERWEPRMLAVAAALVRQWGRSDPAEGARGALAPARPPK